MNTIEYKGNALAAALRTHVLQASSQNAICGTHSSVYSIETPNETFYFVKIIRVLDYHTEWGRVIQIRFHGHPNMRGPKIFSWPTADVESLLVQSVSITTRSPWNSTSEWPHKAGLHSRVLFKPKRVL